MAGLFWPGSGSREDPDGGPEFTHRGAEVPATGGDHPEAPEVGPTPGPHPEAVFAVGTTALKKEE